MSSNTMLKQAIIDANALREVALKNAEATVVEKYSHQIKEAVDNMLEQEEELDMEPDPALGTELGAPEGEPSAAEQDATYGALDGERLCPCPEDSTKKVVVDLGGLQQMMMALDDEEEEGILPDEPLPAPTPGEVLPADDEEPDDLTLEEDDDILFELDDLLQIDEDYVNTPTKDDLGMAAEEEGEAAAEAGSQGLEEDDELEDDPLGAIPTKGLPGREGNIQQIMNSLDPRSLGVPLDDATKAAIVQLKIAFQKQGLIDEGFVAQPADDAKRLRHTRGKHRKRLEQKNKKVLKENTKLTQTNSKMLNEHKHLLKEQKHLLEENRDLKHLLKKVSGTLEEVNLSNAKLIYTNQVLNSASLNERQKQRIVESISSADSVEAAKSIYETLQSAVGSSFKSRDKSQSLSEAITRGSTTVLRQQQKQTKQDPHMQRMKKLAGI